MILKIYNFIYIFWKMTSNDIDEIKDIEVLPDDIEKCDLVFKLIIIGDSGNFI